MAYDWRLVGRDEQQLPDGDWSTWLIMAGRGFGKTRTGSEIINQMAMQGGYGRLALIAETAADARDVMVTGKSGILNTGNPRDRATYNPSIRRVTWPNGAIATTYSAVEYDQLRGPEHDGGWIDELAKFRYAQDAWDMYQMGLRIGNKPRTIITTTPKPIPLLKKIMAEKATIITKGCTMDNAANLSASFIEQITARYAGTRLGRQELEAELLEDVPGALWTNAMLENSRIEALPSMNRIVVGVDPSGTKGGESGDSVGIVVCGKGNDGLGYVIADYTCKLSPDGWGRRVAQAYANHQADRVVAESNFGGAMVEAIIRAAAPSLPVKMVTASRGKVIRAEPVAALYEQGRVKHLHPAANTNVDTSLLALEAQLTAFASSGYIGEGSPDRADAMVWALTDLMLEDTGSMWDMI